jgi:hypothetical protein
MADDVAKKPGRLRSLGEALRDASLRPEELTKSREELVKEGKQKIDDGLHLLADGVRLFLALHPEMATDQKAAFIGLLMETHTSVERVVGTMEIEG